MECPLGDVQKPKSKRIRKKWREDSVKRRYTCEICSMTADLTKTELNAHYKTHGNALGLKKYRWGTPKPDQIFVCELCSTKFTCEEDLDEHMWSHDDEYKCDVCQQGFKTILDYTIHVQSHNDDKLYKCLLCNMSTADVYRIKNHVRHHKMTKRYECPIEECKRAFIIFSHFEEHKYYHTGEKPFVCDICGASFMYTRYLRHHKRTTHDENATKPVTCHICSTVCNGQRRFYNHMWNHQQAELICATCGKIFKKRAGLKLHEAIHAGSKSHKCQHCDKAFTHKRYLLLHERTHTGEKPYGCEHCAKRFNQRSSLVRHVRGHTGEKPHACHFCDRKYTSKSTLNTHLKNCTGPCEWQLWPSSNCKPKSRITRVHESPSLKGTRRQSNWDITSKISPPDGAKTKRTRKKWLKDEIARTYTCEICSMTAQFTRTQVNNHYKTHGVALIGKKHRKRPPRSNRMYVCEVCSKNFSSQQHLDEHLLIHDDQYRCEFCQEGFKKIVDYTIHAQAHSDDKLYKCPMCEFNTPIVYSIKTHMHSHNLTKKYECPIEDCKKGFTDFFYFQEHKYYHTGEKPFICETCGLAFMYSRYLNSHRTRMHSLQNTKQIICEVCSKICYGRRRYLQHLVLHKQPEWVCATCGKVFKKRDGLKLHEMVHAGYKPHKCSYCEKKFLQRGGMVEHERTHTGDRPYDCEHCGKKFTQRSSLVRHVRGHTGEKPYTCHFCHRGYATKSTLTTHLKNCRGPCA